LFLDDSEGNPAIGINIEETYIEVRNDYDTDDKYFETQTITYTQKTENEKGEGWHEEGDKVIREYEDGDKLQNLASDEAYDKDGNLIYETDYQVKGLENDAIREHYNKKSGDLIYSQFGSKGNEATFNPDDKSNTLIYSRDGFIIYRDASWDDNADPPEGFDPKIYKNNGRVDPWEVSGTAYAEGAAGLGWWEVERDPKTGLVTKYIREIDPEKEPELYRELERKGDARWNQGFWRGEDVYIRGTLGAQPGQFSYLVATFVASYQPRTELSSALFSKSGLDRWMQDVDQTFAKYNLGEDYYVSEYCEKEFKTIPDSTALVETPGGLAQLIGHVEAEKSPWLPDEDSPDRERFYKITFGVSAPSDEDLTPYMDEEGAVSFNVVLGGEKLVNLFVDPQTKQSAPINLENGETKNAVGEEAIVKYSKYDYNQICIQFFKKPKDKDGKDIKQICNRIPESTGSIENWQLSQESDDTTGGSTPDTADAAGPPELSTDW